MIPDAPRPITPLTRRRPRRRATSRCPRSSTRSQASRPSSGSRTGLSRSRHYAGLGTTEVWRFINTTADTHPMHLHLAQFQVLTGRTSTSPATSTTERSGFSGTAEAAGANEAGWKDTIQVNPGEAVRIIAQFDHLGNVPGALPHPRTRGERNDAAIRGRARELTLQRWRPPPDAAATVQAFVSPVARRAPDSRLLRARSAAGALRSQRTGAPLESPLADRMKNARSERRNYFGTAYRRRRRAPTLARQGGRDPRREESCPLRPPRRKSAASSPGSRSTCSRTAARTKRRLSCSRRSRTSTRSGSTTPPTARTTAPFRRSARCGISSTSTRRSWRRCWRGPEARLQRGAGRRHARDACGLPRGGAAARGRGWRRRGRVDRAARLTASSGAGSTPRREPASAAVDGPREFQSASKTSLLRSASASLACLKTSFQMSWPV